VAPIPIPLSPDAKNGLLKDGFDIKDWQPQLVTQYDINNASEIITFDCAVPMEGNLAKSIYRWNGTPPISKGYQVARDQIADKVIILIEELEQKKNLQKK